jgi:hypothetical protein
VFARRLAASGLLALLALFGGILGCLRVFGPDLRARGVHASVPSDAETQPDQVAVGCMGCHEAEADALARMEAAKQAAERPAPHAHAHGGEVHIHADPAAPPTTMTMTTMTMTMAMTGPPLVADWMVADSRACTDCHRVRR